MKIKIFKYGRLDLMENRIQDWLNENAKSIKFINQSVKDEYVIITYHYENIRRRRV